MDATLIAYAVAGILAVIMIGQAATGLQRWWRRFKRTLRGFCYGAVSGSIGTVAALVYFGIVG